MPRIFACWAVIGMLIGTQRPLAGAAVSAVPGALLTERPGPPAGPEKRTLVASLRRTPCFGSCPVFVVEIWSDGQAVWRGERNVPRIGTYSAQVSAEWIAELLREGENAGFFDLAPQYPRNGHAVPDLPLTITMLRRGHHEHRVIDNADAPLALQRFERYWQEKAEALPWKPVEQ